MDPIEIGLIPPERIVEALESTASFVKTLDRPLSRTTVMSMVYDHLRHQEKMAGAPAATEDECNAACELMERYGLEPQLLEPDETCSGETEIMVAPAEVEIWAELLQHVPTPPRPPVSIRLPAEPTE